MKNNKIFIETYGCQMNKLDSENVHAILESGGYNVVDKIFEADIIILNTCGVRDNAEKRVKGRITELHRLKKNNPGLFFGIIGCMAERLGDELLFGDVKLVAGPDSYRKLPEMLKKAVFESVMEKELNEEEIYGDIYPARKSNVSAWIAVTRGCGNYCSYCIVPYTRGKVRSIPAEKIVTEAENLKKNGWKEITLLGQNVNSYSSDGVSFSGLLRLVSDTGIESIRFLTSHPKDLTTDIIKVMAERENICQHLHLPLQSGSDKILGKMNRKYISSHYIYLIEMAREMLPDIRITTDIIFGFPGENEDDYAATIDIMEKIRFDYAFLYRYSEREGTVANLMKDKIPEKIRLERLSKAIEIQNKISLEKNLKRIGTKERVLVKDISKDGNGWLGFNKADTPVVVRNTGKDIKIGAFIDVEIESATCASLKGK
jgi:tRNA-2-methylthio-N6-dimethylallyladenosine synthase